MVSAKLRYLVLEVLVPNEKKRPTKKLISKAISSSVQENFGLYGAAVSGDYFQVKYFNPVTSILVLRCGRKDYSKIWSAVTLLRYVTGVPTTFNLLILSGNTRVCRKKLQEVEADRLQLLKNTPSLNLSADLIKRAESYVSGNASLD